ncbi:hypothetical protein V8E54_003294 [Elaphomyces granulatus]
MQLTQIFTILAVAVASTAAAPDHKPPPPPSVVQQQISCNGNSNPYCCSPNASAGYTCTGLVGSSVNCNAITICCNNNGGEQDCGGFITGPVVWN